MFHKRRERERDIYIQIQRERERERLAMRIFDEYSNVLRCMYSTRFNERTARSVTETKGREQGGEQHLTK